MINTMISKWKKIASDTAIGLAKRFFPHLQGHLIGFRAGIGIQTLVKDDGELIPGHGKGVFVEVGKSRDIAKDALNWGKTLNTRKKDFGKEHEKSEGQLALIAVLRRHDSDDYDYIYSKILDTLPEGEDKEADNIYSVTPTIGKVSKKHYMGIEMIGGTEEEKLQSVDKFIDMLHELKCELKYKQYKNDLIKEKISAEKKSKIESSLNERRSLKKEDHKHIKYESNTIYTKKQDLSNKKFEP